MTIHARRAMGALLLGMLLTLAAPLVQADDTGSAPARAAHHGAARVPHNPPPQAAPAVPNGKLALQAPALNRLYPRRQLRYILADPGPDVDEPAQVEVERAKEPVVVPMGQLYAIPWAILHPAQAWRILSPVADFADHVQPSDPLQPGRTSPMDHP